MAILVTRIHELRKRRKMQQAELADLVGVRRETIGKLENGKYNPSLKLAWDIAHVFGKSIEEVFNFELDEDDEEQADKRIMIYKNDPDTIFCFRREYQGFLI